jgi:hypothetical protein
MLIVGRGVAWQHTVAGLLKAQAREHNPCMRPNQCDMSFERCGNNFEL